MSELTAAQQHVLDEAQKVNQERMAAVEDLAKAVARRVDLEHELNEAKKEEKRLMVTAERQGWTTARRSLGSLSHLKQQHGRTVPLTPTNPGRESKRRPVPTRRVNTTTCSVKSEGATGF